MWGIAHLLGFKSYNRSGLIKISRHSQDIMFLHSGDSRLEAFLEAIS